ncbi:hypothetical protein H4Q26_017603 [Puccinia striiformis f. sp. tritici PST-130]|nr:hypothetical protein H4Q26_017603 [Puccinia striiformis f. sp. tritici PST-130]
MGATLIDSLDTLLIMNLTREYNYARTHVKAVDWAWAVEMQNNWGQSAGGGHPEISLFETVIRFDASKSRRFGRVAFTSLWNLLRISDDPISIRIVSLISLSIAVMLAIQHLLSICQMSAISTTDTPQNAYLRVYSRNPRGKSSGRVVTADVGSLTLEFTRLSQLTSKDYYTMVCSSILGISMSLSTVGVTKEQNN